MDPASQGSGLIASLALALSSPSDPSIAVSTYGCTPVETMPREMAIETRYAIGDTSYERIDPTRARKQRNLRIRFSRPAARIAALADLVVAAPAGSVRRASIAQCLALHLAVQASGQAMMGATSQFDFFYRDWMIAGIALSYLKVRDDLTDNPNDPAIRTWLRESGSELAHFAEARIKRGLVDNHSYWAGLAVMAVGRAVNDNALVGVARKIRARGLAQVDRDGILAAETKRRTRSFHYHVFAAAPLAMLIALDPKAISQDEEQAITRLADRIAVDLSAKSGRIAAVTGAVQREEDRPELFYLLLGRVSNPAHRAVIRRAIGTRPCRYPYLGGDFCRWVEPS